MPEESNGSANVIRKKPRNRSFRPKIHGTEEAAKSPSVPFYFSSRCKMIKSAILKVLFLPLSLIFAARKNTVGGQAIIEGVMMRGKDKVSWAVRRGPSEVMVEQFPFTSVCKKHKFLSRPVLRSN